MIRRILLGFFILMAVYYLTFLIFGTNRLKYQLLSDSNSSYYEYQWKDTVNIISNINLEDHNTEQIQALLGNEEAFTNHVMTDDEATIANFFFDSLTYNYLIIISPKYSPYVKVQEGEKIEEYGAFWEKEYIWFFFKWLKLKDLMIGIS